MNDEGLVPPLETIENLSFQESIEDIFEIERKRLNKLKSSSSWK
jgi:hypothetical protein